MHCIFMDTESTALDHEGKELPICLRYVLFPYLQALSGTLITVINKNKSPKHIATYRLDFNESV